MKSDCEKGDMHAIIFVSFSVGIVSIMNDSVHYQNVLVPCSA